MILSKKNIESIDLDFLINQKIKAGKLGEFLLIVPTNRKIRALKREIISLTSGKASGKINLETIGTFAGNMLFMNGNPQGETLSEAASAVLLKQSVDECRLKYFSAYDNWFPHGTLTRIREVISEYKKHGITPEILLKESNELEGSEKNKAEDIAAIFDVYQSKCRQLNVKETGDVYFEVNGLSFDSFENNFKVLYPDVQLIVINGFDEFTSPEIDIISSASKINGVDLFISFDYYAFNPGIFSHLDKCYEKLKKKGFVPVKDASLLLHHKFENEIREKLFRLNVKEKQKQFVNSITRINAANREKEVELIAKEIKELIQNKGVKPNSICVIFNLIQNYSSIVRDVFQLYGLPFNLTDRIPLDSSAPVISIINFLEILENDFYYRNIFRALSSGYLKFDGIDKSNLLKASVDLKIISGYSNWKNSINDALARMEEDDDDENKYSIRDKEAYEKALADLETLYNRLQPFREMMTLKEFVDNLNNLVFTFKLPAKLVNNTGDSIEENIKGITTLTDLINEIFRLFEIEYGSSKKFPLSFFMSAVKTAASSSRFNIKEKPGFGVQVTNMEEIRGLKFDYLFIGGLCDGDMPTRYSPEIFFSGSFQKNEMIHQTEERFRFYQSLCSWREHLYLTNPMMEDKKELVESNLLDEFCSLIETTTKSEMDFSKFIYSKEELLINLAENNFERLPENFDKAEYKIDTDKIKNSIDIDRIRRLNPFEKSEYTGWINNNLGEEAENALADIKFREFSISQLETYAKCPYKYMAERILKLNPVEEPTEDIEALEMGSLLHSILYRFYTQIKEKGIVLAEAVGQDIISAEKLLFSIAEKVIDDAGFHSPLTFYEKEKVLGIGGDRKNSVLYKFLLEEIADKSGYIPEYFELAFGGRTAGENNPVKIKIDNVNVTGKIDRIDIDKENKRYKVIDYKLSGKKPSVADLQNGLSLQLPLYLYAAREMIKAQLGNGDYEPSGAEIYSLKFSDEEFGRQLVKLLPARAKFTEEKLIESYKEMIEGCISAIKKYVKDISEGKFNLSELEDRENKVCRYCSFRPVCRIQEIS